MNAKEKAVELIEIFRQTEISYYEAKQCAIIAVDEILNCASNIPDAFIHNQIEWYWQEVKTELEVK